MMHYKLDRFGRGAVALQSRADEALDLDTIRRHVPAVFAEEAHDSRSSRFVPVPTGTLLEGLWREGFRPFSVGLAGTGDDTRRAYTSHMIRLRHVDSPPVRPEFGRIVPEIVISNANDGSAAYGITLGLFRFVCLNGLMVGQDFASARVPHVGRAAGVVDRVIEGTYTVVKDAPMLVDSAARFHATTMPQDARLAFANDALALRWGAEPAPITADQALAARRSADAGADIWSTFNVLQEAVMRGGHRYTRTGNAGVAMHRRVRPLKGLGDQGRINRALWDEATHWQRALAA